MKATQAARLAALVLVLGACSDSSGPEPRRAEGLQLGPTPASVADGDTLQMTATVLDQDGQPFATPPSDVTITWSSSNTANVAVLPDGRVVGNHPGTARVTATGTGGISAFVDVTVTQVATGLAIVSGANQQGTPGQPLPDSVVLRVIDRHHDGVPGTVVTFGAVSGGGSVSPAQATSDAGGIVRVEWTLGDQPTQQMSAQSASGVSIPINATFAPVVVGSLDMAETTTVGGALTGSLRIDSSLYTAAVGASHVVLSWDPAVLQLVPASLASGDFARWSAWYDNGAGELHMVASDPDAVVGDLVHTQLQFTATALGGTTVALQMPQLVAVNYNNAGNAARPLDLQVTVN